MEVLGHGPGRRAERALARAHGRGYGVPLVYAAASAQGSPTAASGGTGSSEALFIADLGLLLLVSRRPGETLHFGNTATAVLDRFTVSNLFVASW
jgi:hypothetical protein